MTNKNPELFIDVRKFNQSDFAAAITENRRAKEDERISPFDMEIDLCGFTKSWDKKKKKWIEFPMGMDTELNRREADAVYVLQQMARQGSRNIILISPPGGDKNYPTARLILYKVGEVSEEKVRVKSWGICGTQSAEDCLDIAQRMVNGSCKCMGELENPEDLRMYPIGFEVEEGGEIRYLRNNFLGMEEVWDKIESDAVEEDFQEAESIAEYVDINYRHQMDQVNSYEGAVILGARIEMDIKLRFGRSLLGGGAHGMSNEAALGMMGGGVMTGNFDKLFNLSSQSLTELDSRLEICEKCGRAFMKKKKRCPKCYPDN